MKICSTLQTILDFANHPIYVLIQGVQPEDVPHLTRYQSIKPSTKVGEKVFIGNLRPSEIKELQSILSDKVKIEAERNVPASEHDREQK